MNDLIHELSVNYNWSQDYPLLVELMEKESIVCKVKYRPDIFDTAHSLCNGMWAKYAISARGTCYVSADDKEEFIQLCKDDEVSFLVPSVQPKVKSSGLVRCPECNSTLLVHDKDTDLYECKSCSLYNPMEKLIK